MFQPKVRRVIAVLTLTAALSLIPLADAAAARTRTAGKQQPVAMQLLAQVEAQLSSFWLALQTVWGDSGPRMDDNG